MNNEIQSTVSTHRLKSHIEPKSDKQVVAEKQPHSVAIIMDTENRQK